MHLKLQLRENPSLKASKKSLVKRAKNLNTCVKYDRYLLNLIILKSTAMLSCQSNNAGNDEIESMKRNESSQSEIIENMEQDGKNTNGNYELEDKIQESDKSNEDTICLETNGQSITEHNKQRTEVLSTAFDDSCWKSNDDSFESFDHNVNVDKNIKTELKLEGNGNGKTNRVEENDHETSRNDYSINERKRKDHEIISKSSLSQHDDINETRSSTKSLTTTKIDKIQIKWSEELSTPCIQNDIFSPSQDINKSSNNIHGLGLTLTTDRSKQIFKCQKRLAKFINSIADLHDSLAHNILKACQTLSNSMDASISGVSIPVETTLNQMSSFFVSYGKQTQGIAMGLKGSISKPLETTATDMMESLSSIMNNYVASREQCFKTRIKSIRQKNKYHRAVRDAEISIKELEKAKLNDANKSKANANANNTLSSNSSITENENNASNSLHEHTDDQHSAVPPSNSSNNSSKNTKSFPRSLSRKSERVLQSLRTVQTCEDEYRTLVKKENDSIMQARANEAAGLEMLQKIEDERLQLFISSFTKMLRIEIDALDTLTLEYSQFGKEENPESNTSSSKKRSDAPNMLYASPPPTSIFNKIMIQADDGCGVTEAESLNLPTYIGEMRNEMKNNLVAISQRSSTVKLVYAFVEEIACAIDNFSSGIVTKLVNEGYTTQGTKNDNVISISMPQVEGSKVLRCWTEVIETLIHNSQSSSSLSKTIRGKNHEYLDQFLLKNEKNFKTMSDSEESRWKSLCDAAKNEVRARTKRDQLVTDLAKAKEKLNDYDEEIENHDKYGDKLNPAMRKALGNMFSILPNRGEEAMSKILHPKARQAIAKTNYDDTKMRLDKESQSYQNIVRDLENAILCYKMESQTLQNDFQFDEEYIWGKIQQTVENMMTSLQNFRVMRYTILKPASALLNEHDLNTIMLDMKDWSFKVCEQYSTHIDAIKDKNDVVGQIHHSIDPSKMFLTLEILDSPTVYGLMSLLSTDEEQNERCEQLDDSDNKGDICDANENKNLTDNKIEVKINPGVPESALSTESLTQTNASSSHNSTKVPDTDTEQSNLDLVSLASTLKEAIEARNIETESNTEKKVQNDRSGDYKAVNAETEIFLQHFHDDKSKDPPTVLESYSCAYHPKEDSGLPYYLLHGRMFLTPETLYFVGWGDTKVIVQLKDIASITKEANVMGVVNNSLRIWATHDGVEKSYYFGSFAFREKCYQMLNRMVALTKSIVEIVEPGKKDEVTLPPVPPDETLKTMEIVVNKKIRAVSVEKFFNLCMADTESPFYELCLEKLGNKEISVGDWELSSQGFKNEWCGEIFSRKRVS